MEAYRIKHKPTGLYYDKYAKGQNNSCLIRTTKNKKTLYKVQEDNILSCKGKYVTVKMRVKSCFLSLYDRYFSKLEQEKTKQEFIAFKIPKTDFEIEPVEKEKEEEEEATDSTAPIDEVQALRDEINKQYEELNANVGLDDGYFLNKCREISVLTNKLKILQCNL